jgi:hypothetical protein
VTSSQQRAVLWRKTIGGRILFTCPFIEFVCTTYMRNYSVKYSKIWKI